MRDLKTFSKAVQGGDRNSKFVMEQIVNFGKVQLTWQEPMLGECVLWKATPSKGYDHVRVRKLLKLLCLLCRTRCKSSSDLLQERLV